MAVHQNRSYRYKKGLLPIASFGTSAYGYAEDVGVRTLLQLQTRLASRINAAREALGAQNVARKPFVPPIRDDDVIRAFIIEEGLMTMRQRMNAHALWGQVKDRSSSRLLRGFVTTRTFEVLMKELQASELDSSTVPPDPFFTNDATEYLEEARGSFAEAESSDAFTSKQKKAFSEALVAMRDPDFARRYGELLVQGFVQLARVLAGLDELSAVACAARDDALRGLDPSDSISQRRRRKAIRAMRDAINHKLPDIRSRELPSSASAPDAVVVPTPATDSTPGTPRTPVAGETESGTTTRSVFIPPPLRVSAVLINVSLERRQTLIDRTCAGQMFQTYAVGREPGDASAVGREAEIGEYVWNSVLVPRFGALIKKPQGALQKRSRRLNLMGRGSRRLTRKRHPSPTTRRTRSRRRRRMNGAPSSWESTPV